jgi:hypothetical protein
MVQRVHADGAALLGRLDQFDATASKIVKPVPQGDVIRTVNSPSKPSAKGATPVKPQPEDAPTVTEFTPVGIGQPMKITLEQLYVGDTPRPVGELLVVSATKDRDDAKEAPASMHWWGKKVATRTHPNMSDGSAGSAIMYYSPAEAATTLEVVVRLKFDYFPEDVVEAWRDAAVDVLGLPILIGGITFGVGGAAAAQAIVGVADAGSKLAVGLLDQAIDGEGAMRLGGDLTIAQPGRTEAQAGYLVLTPDGYTVKSRGRSGSSVVTGYTYIDGYESGISEHEETIDIAGMEFFVSNSDGKLKHTTDGKWKGGKNYEAGETVEGPWAYAVISIDGKPDDDLKKWKPATVTADLAAKFLNRRKDSALPELTEKVFSSYSDAVMIGKAADLQEKIQKKTAEIEKAKTEQKEALEKAKELLEKQRTALVDAIEDDKLKELVTG